MYHNTITAAPPCSNNILFAIPGYPHYFIDVKANCFSDRSGTMKALVPKKARNGYLVLRLRVNGHQVFPYLHTLMLLTFVGPRPEGQIACHGPDPTKSNCAIGNLRWDTRRANAADYIQAGGTYGYEGGPKLTPDDVRAIRKAKAEGATNRSLSDRYCVGLDAIRCVIQRTTWSHVE